MIENKDIILTYASALQEIAILFFVFGPMYLTFDSNISGWLLALGVLAWNTIGFALFRIGIEVQRRCS
jgi:hypothetical protein